jgi:GNAT superfamily N-acetyltransferase
VKGIPPDLDVRLAPLDDPERFAPLMQAAFGLQASPRHFTWKYLENPAGRGAGFEAIGPNGAVAFRGVIPETYLVQGKRMRVHQGVDSMVHPDYRGRGVYMALMRRMYEHLLAEEGGYTLVAFSNEKMVSVLTKRDRWTHLHTIPFMFLPRIIHRVRPWRSRAKDVVFTTVKRATELEPYLGVRGQPARAVTVELSPEFLQWRGFDNPYNPAQACLAWRGDEPVGMCLFSTDARSRCLIQLADFITPQMCGHAFDALAAFLFEQTGASVLYTWEPVDDARRAVLRRSGFVKNPVRRGPGSARYSLVARSEPRLVHGHDWLDPANFEVQPIMHD